MKRKKYLSPESERTEVEMEQSFMAASVFEPGKEDTQDGLSIEEHGFAKPEQAWEGDYSEEGWD